VSSEFNWLRIGFLKQSNKTLCYVEVKKIVLLVRLCHTSESISSGFYQEVFSSILGDSTWQTYMEVTVFCDTLCS
jgi:hypothetical protein